MILTRGQIVNLNEAIVKLEEKRQKEKNKYFILSIRNIRNVIKSEVDNIIETFKPSEEFNKFKYEQSLLFKKYATIKSDGNYNIVDNKIEIQVGKSETFKKENDEINKKYSEEIKNRQKEIKELEEILNTTIELPINKIPFEIIPDFITDELYDWLLPILILPESKE